MQDVHKFIGQRMELDKDERDMLPNETRETYNLRSGNTSTNGKGCLEPLKSNLDISTQNINAAFTLPSGDNNAIFSVKDIENSALVYFVHNSNGQDSIWRIFSDNRIEKIAQYEYFAFGKISHANVLNNMLFWTDGKEYSMNLGSFNPPRKINMVRATAMTNQYNSNKLSQWEVGSSYNTGQTNPKVEYLGNLYELFTSNVGQLPTNPIYWKFLRTKFVTGDIVGYTKAGEIVGHCYQCLYNATIELPTDETRWELIEYKHYESLTLQNIMRGKFVPFQPTWEQHNDESVPPVKKNNLRDKIFQFRTRFIYDDNEKSTWSCMSTPVLLNLEYQDGYYSDPCINNTVKVSFETGTKEVVRIQLAVRINEGDWVLVDDLHKYTPSFAVIIPSDDIYIYSFKNDTSTLPLDQIETNNLFSYVPQISGCQEVIQGNRIVDADITEGYNYPDVTCTTQIVYRDNTNSTESNYPINYYGEGVSAYIVLTMPTFDKFIPVSFLRFGIPKSLSQKTIIEYFPKNETTVLEILNNLVIKFTENNITALVVGTTQLRVNSFGYDTPTLFSLITNADKLGGLKYSSTQNMGIVFFDELKRSTSVFKLPSQKIKSVNEILNGVSASETPSPVIDFILTGQPPIQAYSYKFCHTDSRYLFLDITVSNAYISNSVADRVIKINIDRAVLDYRKAKPNSVVEPWTWIKEDRIRVIGYSNYDSIEYLKGDHDFEITKYESNPLTGVVEYSIPYSYLSFNRDWVVEIYRDIPANKEATVYFECGKEYLINNPRTSARAYSELSGTIGSYDTFQRTRLQKGSYAYIVDEFGSSLQIIDVSIPTAPIVVSSTATKSIPIFVAVAGNYAYVVLYAAELQVFDISNVTLPVSVATLALDYADSHSIRINGNYAYVITGNDHRIQTINISNPLAPVKYPSIPFGLGGEDIAFKGTHAYATSFEEGRIDVVDISNPQIPVIIGTPILGLTNPRRMFISGDYLFVANSGGSDVYIYNISNEALPVYYSQILTDPNPYSVFIQGDYAYIVCYDNATLQISDISTIGNSHLVKKVTVGTNPFDVFVLGRYAYTVNYGSSNMSIVDVSDPENPIGPVNVVTKVQPRSLFVSGSSSFNSIESRDYSDIFKSDQGDRGRVAVYSLELKRQRIKTLKRWSGTRIQNTFLNNLNFNDYANYDESNETFGAITKIFEFGDILTVRQIEKNTTYYLSKASLAQASANGEDIVTTSTSVLGSQHQSVERYGCSNPESHVSIGSVNFYLDIKNGLIRDGYSESKVISDEGIKNYLKDLLLNSTNIICVGGYDYQKDELIYTIKYTRYGQQQTVTLLYNDTEKAFKSFLEYDSPECYGNIGLSLYAFTEGVAVQHEAGEGYGNFFGTDVKPKVTIIGKTQEVGVFKAIKLVSNKEWKSDSIFVFENDTYQRGMQSKLPKMVRQEGYYYSGFLRDMTTNSPTPNINDLYNGQRLRGNSIKVVLEAVGAGLIQLYEVGITSTPSL